MNTTTETDISSATRRKLLRLVPSVRFTGNFVEGTPVVVLTWKEDVSSERVDRCLREYLTVPPDVLADALQDPIPLRRGKTRKVRAAKGGR